MHPRERSWKESKVPSKYHAVKTHGLGAAGNYEHLGSESLGTPHEPDSIIPYDITGGSTSQLDMTQQKRGEYTVIDVLHLQHFSGWWLSHLPLWKMMEWKSVGMMAFPTEWKNPWTSINIHETTIYNPLTPIYGKSCSKLFMWLMDPTNPCSPHHSWPPIFPCIRWPRLSDPFTINLAESWQNL